MLPTEEKQPASSIDLTSPAKPTIEAHAPAIAAAAPHHTAIADDKGPASARSSISRTYSQLRSPVDKNEYGVNVERAEANFAELSRELSHASRISRQNSRVGQTLDVEKEGGLGESHLASDGEQEPFDLEAVLRGIRAKRKRMGSKVRRSALSGTVSLSRALAG